MPRKYTPEEEAVVAAFRVGPCELCNRPGPTDAAHIFSVGAGGPTADFNLVALCRYCHSQSHAGFPQRWVLQCVAAVRMGVSPMDIEEAVFRHRRERSKR